MPILLKLLFTILHQQVNPHTTQNLVCLVKLASKGCKAVCGMGNCGARNFRPLSSDAGRSGQPVGSTRQFRANKSNMIDYQDSRLKIKWLKRNFSSNQSALPVRWIRWMSIGRVLFDLKCSCRIQDGWGPGSSWWAWKEIMNNALMDRHSDRLVQSVVFSYKLIILTLRYDGGRCANGFALESYRSNSFWGYPYCFAVLRHLKPSSNLSLL